MTVRTSLITRLTTGAALVAAAALLAPVAQAQRPDDQGDARGPGAIAQVQSEAQSSTSVRPDDRAGVRGPGAFDTSTISSPTRPDDRAEPRGPGAIEQPTVVVTQSSATGFDWSDAFVGALGGIGTALLLTGALFLLLSQRTRARVA